MNKRKTIISAVLTFLILLGGMAIYKMLTTQKKVSATISTEKESLRSLKVRQLQSNSTTNNINIDGRLSAYEKVNLSANVSGILLSSSRTIKKGTVVKKGDLLFKIDQEKAVFNLYALRSSLLNAITLIMPDLKIDYPQAHTKWKKYLDDFEVEAAIKPLPQITSEQEKYFVVSRNILTQYYNIKSAESQLEDYKIYAPFSGVITQTDVFPGTLVMPGQPLAQMINSNHYELEAPVTAKELSFIKKGNRVELFAEAPNKSWTGKVVRISNQIDRTTQRIPVFIRVNGKDLKEGMYLKGQIKGALLKDIIMIPKDFIVEQEYVYTIKDSILQLQRLDIKSRDSDFIYAKQLEHIPWMVQEDPRGLFEGQKIAPDFER